MVRGDLGQHKCYVGRFCNSQEFGWQMWLAGCRCGLREAFEVVYLGDGAGWVRSEHERHFHRAVFIIDWYHASEHMWDCGKLLFGQGTEAADRWVHQRLSLLWEGQTRRLLEDLQQYRCHRVGKRLKQSGMIWSRAGSSATLALRICRLNGQRDSFWRQKPLAA